MSKEDEIKKQIAAYAVMVCQKEFGFAGEAISDDTIYINSGKDKDLTIVVKASDS